MLEHFRQICDVGIFVKGIICVGNQTAALLITKHQTQCVNHYTKHLCDQEVEYFNMWHLWLAKKVTTWDAWQSTHTSIFAFNCILTQDTSSVGSDISGHILGKINQFVNPSWEMKCSKSGVAKVCQLCKIWSIWLIVWILSLQIFVHYSYISINDLCAA